MKRNILLLYTTCFKSWNFNKAGAWNLNQLQRWRSSACLMAGAMQPDLKARIPAKIKTNFWNTLCIIFLLFFTATDATEWDIQDNCSYEDNYSLDERNFYGQIFAGANFLQNAAFNGNKSKYNTGYVIGGSFGYHLCGGLHMEAEYAYRRNGIKEIHFFGQGSSHHGHFQTSSYMANLLWDFPISECALSNIRPFVGVGMGYDIQKLQASNSQIDFHQKWNHFSWQMMAGLAYPIFCNTEVSFEYKFHRSSGYFCNHCLGVGLSYTFDILGY